MSSTACALKMPPITRPMYMPPTLEGVQSSEARSFQLRLRGIENSIRKTHEAYIVFDDAFKTNLIHRVLSDCGMYASFSYIAKVSRLGNEDLERLLQAKQFRKSVMRTKKGESMFILNTPFGALKDHIAAFRYLCAIRA